MEMNIARWRHVFKLDPDRAIRDEDLMRICTSGTDAVMVGGSSGITYENVHELLVRLEPYDVPKVLEATASDAVVTGFDYYFIPVVLNAGEVDWVVGHHHAAIKEHGAMIPWARVRGEGYIILNPHSTAALVTDARAELSADDVTAYARMADQLYRLPILYIEYSGKFGDMDIVAQARAALSHAQLFYGGGIDGLETAIQAAQYADTIVVGNCIYEDLEQALATVRIKSMPESSLTF